MSTYGHDPETPEAQMAASVVTNQFACMPEPTNVRSMAVYIFYKENEVEFESNTKLQELLMSTEAGKEFDRQMLYITEAQDNGTFMDLYERYNPNLSKSYKNDKALNQDDELTIAGYRNYNLKPSEFFWSDIIMIKKKGARKQCSSPPSSGGGLLHC